MLRDCSSEALPVSIRYLPIVTVLNPVQQRVVKSVGAACLTAATAPKVALIQGPPGTGKTSTIVALVLNIIYRFRHYNAKVRGRGGEDRSF